MAPGGGGSGVASVAGVGHNLALVDSDVAGNAGGKGDEQGRPKEGRHDGDEAEPA